uniref:Dickkopf-related protein 3-like protein n=1 Tax=Callorhinchus milii TaxID=7868 RepID=V9KRV4_CALMI
MGGRYLTRTSMMLCLALFLSLSLYVTAAPAALEAKNEAETFVKVVDFDSLPLNYHDEENEEELVGDKIFHKYEKIDKETDDITGDTILSEREVIEEDDDSFPEKRVCLMDTDCGENEYCSSLTTLKCQQCKLINAACSREAECCPGYLCVWGKCTDGFSRGERGTICTRQRDCNSGLCCANHISLPFAVCSPMATEGERCYQPDSGLLGLIGWELKFNDPQDLCPCAGELTCVSTRLDLDSACVYSDEIITGIDSMEENRVPLLRSVVRRANNLDYYPDILPRDEEHDLAVENIPQMAYLYAENQEADRDPRIDDDIRGVVDEGKSFILGLNDEKEKMDLSRAEYKELKRLADDIGLHFRPEYF